jgi:glycosyltransferase involved in cell wall biosynthesis
MRAILSSYEVPEPDRDSGARRLHHFLDFLLAEGWQVSFLAANGRSNERAVARLRRRGVSIHDGVREEPRAIFAGGFDLALLAFWTSGARYTQTIRETSPRTRVIVDSVDLHFIREARQVEQGGMPDEEYEVRKAAELGAYWAADAVLTVSDDETRVIDELIGQRGLAHTVPDGEDLPASELPFAARRGILYVGSFQHTPNVGALEHLCRDILPRINPALLTSHPVRVVGNALDDTVQALGAGLPYVQMVGWVPEVTPYFHQSRISVVPLLYGGGTKRKVIQALITGTPTVSTTIGIEGLGLRDGDNVLVADDCVAFAARVTRLLTDEPLWRRLAAAGRAQAAATHGLAVSRRRLLDVVERVMAGPPRAIPQQRRISAERPKPAALRPRSAPPSAGRLEAPAMTGRAVRADQLHSWARAPLPRPLSAVASGASTRWSRRAPPPNGAHLAVDGTGVRLIAFYLPQFHPLPENDAWWGEGFTEWRNVVSASPQFPGHYQPQLPADLGFYDLRCAETRQSQADLARDYGIHGFCYYHYWFHGKRLLERPFEEVLSSGSPDFPFCLCWANDPWSRRWDGRTQDLLQAQTYSSADDVAHILALLSALCDRRAIRVGERPLFLVYRANDLPEPARTTSIWREEARRAGLPGLFLVAVETAWDLGWDATRFGFDAKVLFQPQFRFLRDHLPRIPIAGNDQLRVHNYAAVWPRLARMDPVDYTRFETVCPGWDNTARMGGSAVVLHGSTPAEYGCWLEGAVRRALVQPPDQRLVFVNAWNEWGEGCHLEPDTRHGLAYLEETMHVLARCARAPLSRIDAVDGSGV